MSKADAAAESAFSAAVGAERGGGRLTSTRLTESSDAETTAKALEVMVLVGASTTGRGTVWGTTTSAPMSSSGASVGSMSGAVIVSGVVTRFSASSAFSMSTRTSTSTSVAHEPSDSGGTPLDVGEQGVGVKKRAGSLLGLAIAFVVGVWF